MKKYIAEMIGTMVLVLMGCGSAVFAGGLADTVGAGVGTIGVAFSLWFIRSSDGVCYRRYFGMSH